MNNTLFRRVAPPFMARFMKDFSADLDDASAVFGNAGHECLGFTKLQEIRPTAGKGGNGWFMWTGARRVEFFNWCAKRSMSPADYEANYGFLCWELRNSEKGALPALKSAHELIGPNGAILVSRLRAKVEAFEAHFERAGVKAYDSRERWAHVAFTAFRQTYPITAPIAPVPFPSPPKPPVAAQAAPSPTPAPKTFWKRVASILGAK